MEGITLPQPPRGLAALPIFEHPRDIEESYKGMFLEEPGFLDGVMREQTGLDTLDVIEAGSGYGRIAIPLALMGHRVTALDGSPTMMRALEENARVRAAPMRHVLADMRDFDAGAGSHDAVICPLGIFNMLWSESSAVAHLRCAARAIRPGGIGLYAVSCAPSLREVSPQRSHWETHRPGVDTWTEYWLAPDAKGSPDLAQCGHVLTVHDRGEWRRLEWLGRVRVFTPEHVRLLCEAVRDFRFETWLRPFDQAARSAGVPHGAPFAYLMLRRL